MPPSSLSCDNRGRAIRTQAKFCASCGMPLTPLVGQATSQKTKEEWLDEGSHLLGNNDYERAVRAHGQALRLNPNDADAYNRMGEAFAGLGPSKN